MEANISNRGRKNQLYQNNPFPIIRLNELATKKSWNDVGNMPKNIIQKTRNNCPKKPSKFLLSSEFELVFKIIVVNLIMRNQCDKKANIPIRKSRERK